MCRIQLVEKETAGSDVARTLGRVESAFGAVPAMFATVANSPAALASRWGSFGALGGGTLGAPLIDQIAVAVADANRCD